MTRVRIALAAGAVLFALCASVALGAFRETAPASVPVVEIGGQTVRVELARSGAERARGLSGRDSLPEGTGMLFVFPQDGAYGFWMKDMRFAIDMLWLDVSGKVVHIVERAAPESYPRSFLPENPARYVLEVPAGFAERFGITLDTTAIIPD